MVITIGHYDDVWLHKKYTRPSIKNQSRVRFISGRVLLGNFFFNRAILDGVFIALNQKGCFIELHF